MTNAERTHVEALERTVAELRERLVALEAAYADLQRENVSQYTDLQSWNYFGGLLLRDRAENVEAQ